MEPILFLLMIPLVLIFHFVATSVWTVAMARIYQDYTVYPNGGTYLTVAFCILLILIYTSINANN